jgi:hypothetical protein
LHRAAFADRRQFLLIALRQNPISLSLWRNYRLLVLCLFGLALAFTGGASRFDENQQMLVRLSALLAIVASLWPLELETLRRHGRAVGALLLLYALIAAQLVPLPPHVWAALPGHEPYARIAAETGSLVWRPLSLTPDRTLNALMALLPMTAAILATLYLDARERQRLGWGIVAIAGLSALLGLIQLIGGGISFHLYRESSPDAPVGLFANRNHQAVLLACALPYAGALGGIRLRDGAGRVLLVGMPALVALILLALVSTGSRMGLALGILGSVAGLWCFHSSGYRMPRGHLRVQLRMAIGAVAVVLLAGVVLAAIHGGAIQRFFATDTVSETRSAILVPLAQTARAFLPLGAGYGAFENVYRQFEPNSLLSTIYMNQAHNEPMQVAIEGGIPALLLLLLFLIWWVRSAWRVARAAQPGRRRAMSRMALSATAILMLSSLVDYPLRTPLLSALFAVACIELMRATHKPA